MRPNDAPRGVAQHGDAGSAAQHLFGQLRSAVDCSLFPRSIEDYALRTAPSLRAAPRDPHGVLQRQVIAVAGLTVC
jgi:hypothetical protein